MKDSSLQKKVDGEFFVTVRATLAGVIVGTIAAYPAFIHSRLGLEYLLLLALPTLTPKRIGWPGVLWVTFAVLMELGALNTQGADLPHQVAMDQVYFAIVFVAIRVIAIDRRSMVLIVYGSLAGALYAVWELYKQNGSLGAQLSLQSTDLSARYTIGQLNANEVSYGLAAATGLAVLIALAHRRLGLLAAVLAGMGNLAGIILTGTRGSEIAFYLTASWALVALLAPRRVVRIALWVVAGAMLFLAIGIFTGMTDELLRQLNPAEAGRETGNLNGRLLIWPVARSIFWQHPFFGIGPGLVQFFTPGGVYAHDVLLDVGTDIGVIGIFVFCAALYVTVVKATEGVDRRVRCASIGAALCSLGPTLLTGYWFEGPGAAVALALFSQAGVALGMRELARDAGPAADTVETRPRVVAVQA